MEGEGKVMMMMLPCRLYFKKSWWYRRYQPTGGHEVLRYGIYWTHYWYWEEKYLHVEQKI